MQRLAKESKIIKKTVKWDCCCYYILFFCVSLNDPVGRIPWLGVAALEYFLSTG